MRGPGGGGTPRDERLLRPSEAARRTGAPKPCAAIGQRGRGRGRGGNRRFGGGLGHVERVRSGGGF